MNKYSTLDFDPETELAKMLNWMGFNDVSVHDSGMKVVLEVDGMQTFFMYSAGATLETMQGHVVSWLMSERSESGNTPAEENAQLRGMLEGLMAEGVPCYDDNHELLTVKFKFVGYGIPTAPDDEADVLDKLARIYLQLKES